jgi:glutathione S-transferase
MFLAEKGVAYDTVEVLIANGAHQAESFKAKNPLQLLPVLELADGRVLRESMAICRYVEELHPTPNLFGEDPWERAQIEQWSRHAELELLWPIGQVFRNSHKFWQGRIKQAPEFASVMRELVHDRLAWFDRELATRSYIAGERFTVADITTLCAIDFGKVVDLRLTNPELDVPHLVAWHTRISGRPSAKA